MNVQFRASFLKDLRNIKNKNVLNRVKEIIELMEKTDTVWDIPNLKS